MAELSGVIWPKHNLKNKTEILRKMMEQLTRRRGFSDIGQYRRRLTALPLDHPEWQSFVNDVRITRSWFFRHPAQLDYVSNRLFPEAIQAKRKSRAGLSIWSSGCASGEEPYTLGLLLQRHPSRTGHSIVATDLNTDLLAFANLGVYSSEKVKREVPRRYQEYFHGSPAPGGRTWHRVDERVRRTIRFDYCNLSRLKLLPLRDLDFIFCRNVLYFLKPEIVRRVTESYWRALRPGGYLVVSRWDPQPAAGLPWKRHPLWIHQKPGPEV